MNQDLRILISGLLNVEQSEKDINKQIQRLSNKVNKLKLNIEIDDNIKELLNSFNKEMKKISDSAKNAGKVIETALLPDGTKVTRSYFNGLKNEFSQIVDESKKVAKGLGQVDKELDGQKVSLDELSQGYEKLIRNTEKYNAAQKKLKETTVISDAKGINKRTVNTNKNGDVTSYTDTYDYAKEEKLTKDALKKQEKIIEDNNKRLRGLVEQRKKLKQELMSALADGAINQSQFSNFSKNLNFAKNSSDLEHFKSVLNSTIAVTKQQTSTDQQLSKAKADLYVKLQKLQIQSQLTNDQFKDFAKQLNLKQAINDVKLLDAELANVTKKSSKTNTKANPNLLLGQADFLKDLSISDERTIKDALKVVGVIEDQRKVIASSLNASTGQWSATIKESNNQQRILKGTIDQTNGSLYKQSEAIQDISARHQGFGKQLSIAMNRTLTWTTAMTA